MKQFKYLFRVVFTLFMVVIIAVFGYNTVMEHLYPQKYSELVLKYSTEFDVNAELVFAVIKCESNFDHKAQSEAGAYGLMQLTDATFTDVKKMLGDSHETSFSEAVLDPEINVRYGTRYLKYLSDYFSGEKVAVIAAYNAGLGNVGSWIKNGSLSLEDIRFPETKEYVKNVLKAEKYYTELYKTKGES